MATERVRIGTSALVRADLTVGQGKDNPFRFNWATRATPEDEPVAVNLTGYTARAQLRNRVGGTVWLSLTSGDGIVLTSGGDITVTIAAADTEPAAWNNYRTGVWDLELISAGGTVTRFAEGTVTISHDVTRV